MTLIDNSNDRLTFEIFYNRTFKTAYAVAMKYLHDHSLAEDVCSEAYLSIAKNFRRIRKFSSHEMDSYLVITIRNTSFNMLKKEKKYRESADIDEMEISLDNDILENMNYKMLVDCIEKLKQTDRDILYLRVTLGLDYKQIASSFGITEEAARQRFRHAKSSLAVILEKEGFL